MEIFDPVNSSLRPSINLRSSVTSFDSFDEDFYNSLQKSDDSLLGTYAVTSLSSDIVSPCSRGSRTPLATDPSKPLDALIRVYVNYSERYGLREKLKHIEISSYFCDQEAVATAKDNKLVALKIINSLPINVPTPKVACTEDGEIVIFWNNGAKRASIEISNAEDIGYAMREGNRHVGGREALVPGKIPEDLFQYLLE